ncbi:MAG TPA: AAA family ATPase [Acidimicrobiales bacterium]|nr:AAA family ATPase [Acidimicrobiales bacterium]
MTSHTDNASSGLAWPDHDSGPVPPPSDEARRRDERETRKPLGTWDRVKFLVLIGGVWLVLVWAAMADDPNLPFGDAVRTHVRSNAWLLVLFGLEVLRQLHYLISERSVGYHRWWTNRFAAAERRTGKMNDWTRYRMGRAFKFLLVLVLAAVVLGKAYDVSPVQGLFRLPTAIWGAMPMIVQVMFFMFLAVIQFVAIFWFLSRGGVETYFPEDIKTRFSDVWGQDPVVERVKENMLFLENPESIEEKGGYVPGGILLWGPPGTGKTLMAEAVAGETGKPYVFVDPGAFTNMFMGVGILKVKSLFRKLRKLAVRYGGVIAFFDEADSLGNRGAGVSAGFRSPAEAHQWERLTSCNGLNYTSPATASMVVRAGMASGLAADEHPGLVSRFVMGAGMGGGGMGTLQALLSELSGLKKPRGFVNRVVRRSLGLRPKPPPKYRLMIMMATNMPQALDEALLRPGRVDRIYKVGYPSKEGRKRTYEGYFAKVAHELTDADLEKLSVMTPYATGAKIKDMVNESLIVAIRDGRSSITWGDVMRAKQLKDLGPPEDVEYIERERHAVAVHEACHAVAAVKVRRHLTIDIATIEKGGTYLGMVASIPPEDQFTRWRSEYEADIIVSLASLAGERIFFGGDNSSGVSGDLDSATRVATMMEGYWGMGSTVASHGVTHEVGIGGGGRPGSGEGKDGKDREKELLESGLGQRIEEKLADLLHRAERLLRENRQLVLAVAHALESNRTLTGEDVVAIVEGRQGPLLDGRPYHTPEFLELAEQYHNAAVSAHQGHGDVLLPLPRWSANGSNGSGSNGHNGHHAFQPPPARTAVDAEAEEVRVPDAPVDEAHAAESTADDGAPAGDGPVAGEGGPVETVATGDADPAEAASDGADDAAPAPEPPRRRPRRPRD